MDTEQFIISKGDNFIFKKLTSEEAKAIWNTGLFELFSLQDSSDTESLIQSSEELAIAMENGIVVMEVGSIGEDKKIVDVENKYIECHKCGEQTLDHEEIGFCQHCLTAL